MRLYKPREIVEYFEPTPKHQCNKFQIVKTIINHRIDPPYLMIIYGPEIAVGLFGEAHYKSFIEDHKACNKNQLVGKEILEVLVQKDGSKEYVFEGIAIP